jgi:aspartate racemase
LQECGDWPTLGRLLADAARRLEASGAQAITVAANTLHLVADDIRAAITVPFVDMIDVTRDAVHTRGFKRVGLLATGYTMRSDLFGSRFAPDVEVLVPDDAGQKIVHDVIYTELTRGVVREESRQAYLAEIAKLEAAGAQAVILGCTEIGMLLRDGDANVPLIDTTALHVAALVDVIINGVQS